MSGQIRSEIGEQAKELLLPALHAVVDARTAEGVRKYGQTLDQNIKPQRAKVVHLLQEILDALQYVLWGAAEDRQADVMCMQLAGMANALISQYSDLDLTELLYKEGHSSQHSALATDREIIIELFNLLADFIGSAEFYSEHRANHLQHIRRMLTTEPQAQAEGMPL